MNLIRGKDILASIIPVSRGSMKYLQKTIKRSFC